MAYQSIKRVFGETKLELKLLLLFGIGLLTVITASFWWYGNQTAELVYQRNRNTGRLLVDHVMLTTHWRAWEPNNQWQGLIEQISESLSKQKYTIDFIRPHAMKGPGAPQDEFEAKLRERFLQNPQSESADADQTEFAERLLPDANKYQYYQPIRAEDANCTVACHLSPPGIDTAGPVPSVAPPPAQGGLISIAKVTIDNGPTQRNLDWNKAVLWATAIITVGLAMLTSYAIVRYVIVKPLRHLRDVSDSISRGNITLRADIHTGDEFEELSVAFNRMLRHMTTVQEELSQANVNLDAKVDELAQANMRLYELNTIKSDFLATMSHELRTPLNSILGFSEVLGSIAALDDKQKRYVQNIQKSGRTLLDMINDILDLAKMESGKMDIRLTDFRIDPIVHAQCDMARPLTERKNIDLDAVIAPNLPPLRQDQARVQQILNNLLSNAIKFTPEGGRITLEVTRDDEDSLVLRVIDTGVGIAEDEQQVIFEKFRQGRVGVPSGDAMTREYSGSGLGLSIVKELCKLLGGEISVQSELGKGSIFTVRLPWTLREPPRLDSPLDQGIDDFDRPRIEFHRTPTGQ